MPRVDLDDGRGKLVESLVKQASLLQLEVNRARLGLDLGYGDPAGVLVVVQGGPHVEDKARDDDVQFTLGRRETNLELNIKRGFSL